MFCFFVPSNMKLGSAFIFTLVKLVFESFMLTLLVLVLNQMSLLSCPIVTLITLIGYTFILRALMKFVYP